MIAGDIVRYEGENFKVLGHAASVDEHGNKLIEIAWDDYGVSPTGYLAVPESDLELVNPHKSLERLDALADQGLVRRVISPDAKLVLYNYTDKCIFDKKWNKYTLNARGTTYDLETGKVVARAFPKFFNFEELPVSKSRNLAKKRGFEVFDKVDGSLGIIYFHAGAWRVNTRGSFTSEQAIQGVDMLYHKYDTARLNPNFTYLAEIIYPENKIIVDYGDERKLVLLAILDTESGGELSYPAVVDHAKTINMPYAKSFQYETIDDLIQTQINLPASEEGFVVRFSNGERVKFKSREYLKLARLLHDMTPLHFWEHMKNGKVSEDLRRKFPEEFREEADKIVAELQSRWKNLAAEIHQELLPFIEKAHQDENPRKYLGLNAKKCKHFGAVFALLDGSGANLDKYIMKQIRPKGNTF